MVEEEEGEKEEEEEEEMIRPHPVKHKGRNLLALSRSHGDITQGYDYLYTPLTCDSRLEMTATAWCRIISLVCAFSTCR